MKSSILCHKQSVFNVNNYYLINALFSSHLGLIGAMYIVYFYSFGLTKLNTNILSSLFMITVFLMEIPTGAYADIFGTRKCLLLSGLFLFLSMTLFWLGNNIWIFGLAQIMWGLSFAFESGALEAWMVNNSGFKGSRLDNVFAKSGKINNLLAIICGLVAGLLSGISLKWPWLLSVLTTLFYLLLVYRNVNADKCTEEKKIISMKNSFDNIKKIIKTSIEHCINNKMVRSLITFSAIISFSFSPVFVYWSPYLKSLFNNEVWILGWIWMIIKIANLIGNIILEKISKTNISRKLMLRTSIICISIILAIAALSKSFYIVLLMFVIFEILIEIIMPLQSSFVNDWIPNEERATILSFNSMISRLSNFFSLIVMGYIGDKISMQFTWLLVAGLVLFNLIVLVFIKEIGSVTIKQDIRN